MTMFVSTRGGTPVSLTDALFAGLAPDGGLFVPTSIGTLGDPPQSGSSPATTARWAAPRLLPGVDSDVLEEAATAALDFPLPLVEIEPGLHILELFHGPTHAFKDVGARFMARLMSRLDSGGGGTRTILVATSGDTGSAVAHAFHGLAGYRVVVLFPESGVSARQRRQMTTLGGNVRALAVSGTFDDCQRLAKDAFRDADLRARHRLTSANSINIGRLLPQTFYYIHAAILLGWTRSPARFVVPSGNLGNLSGGLIAQRAGMPNRGFVSAVNANRAFLDFLSQDGFQARPSVPTYSNAMDVGDPSNIERIRWLYRDDPTRLRREVSGVSVADAETAATIADIYERTGYTLDPHGAVGVRAHQVCVDSSRGPSVVLATAHPAKFPDVVEKAIGRPVPLPPGIAAVMSAKEHMEHIAATLGALAEALDDA